MSEPRSPWARLDASLRRLARFRELRAPCEFVEKEIELARLHWSQVPPAPDGAHFVWPEDLSPLAQELGFDPDSRDRPPMDSAMAESVAHVPELYRVCKALEQAVEADGAVSDLRVTGAGSCISLHGAARDAESRERVEALASRLAAGMEIRNLIQVRPARGE